MKIDFDDSSTNTTLNNFTTQSFLAPLLSQKILDCANFDIKDRFYANGQIVNINNIDNVIYPEGGAICITGACLSYKCLGLALPVSFFLCGTQYTFEVSDGGCDCVTFVDTLPESIQALINDTITTADSAIGIARTVFSSTSVSDKTQKAYTAALTSSDATEKAIDTIEALFNNSYPTTTDNTVERALQLLISGTNSLGEAQTFATQYVNDLNSIVTNAATIATLLTNALTDFRNAAQEITEITTPTPPQSALTSANTAVTRGAGVQSVITDFTNNPTWNTLSAAIDSVYFIGRYSQTAVFDTATAFATSPANEYANSIGLILYSIFTNQSSADSLYRSYSATGSEQISLLDNSAYASISASNYTKQSVNYPNAEVEETYNIYNNFTAQISIGDCLDKRCCSPPCSNTMQSLFLQPIYSFHACNLSIDVCGTIGGIPFTGSINYPNVTSLADLGFNPINLSALLSIKDDSSSSLVTITERLEPCILLECVYPTGNFNPGTSSFEVDLYYDFNLKAELTVTKRSPIATLSSTSPIICS